MSRPEKSDYPQYYHPYVEMVKGDSIADIISNHSAEIIEFYTSLPYEKESFAYAEEKWTLKQVLQHVTDTERVFVYRALRFARADNTPLASFDEDYYARNDFHANREFDSLKEEFRLLKQSSDLFFRTLKEDQLQNDGLASNHRITVNALAFVATGHLLHHKKIIAERYLR